MAMFRKDLKVGFVVGAVALVGGLGYVLLAGGDDAAPPPDPGVEAMPTAGDPLAPGGDFGSDSPTPAQPRITAVVPAPANPAPAGMLTAVGESPADPSQWNQGMFDTGPIVTRSPSPTATPPAARVDDTAYSAAPVDLNRGFNTGLSSGLAGGSAAAPTISPPPQTDPTPAARPAVPAGGAAHAIASGENFSTLAKKYYGDGNLYFVIQKANPTVDPRRLNIGQNVTIPDRAAADAARSTASTPDKPAEKDDAASPPADSGYTHVVAPNETLRGIAERRLGRANLWQDIYDLNKAIIGDDAGALQVGMTLRLPK